MWTAVWKKLAIGQLENTDIFVTAVGLTPGGSSTLHLYTQTIHRTTQLTNLFGRLSGI